MAMRSYRQHARPRRPAARTNRHRRCFAPPRRTLAADV